MSDTTGKVLLAVLNDLIFETKIRSTAQALGVNASIVRSVGELPGALNRIRPALVIIDLNSLGASALEAVGIVRSHAAGSHVIAYVSHVDADLASRAEDAGADQVMPRSRFSTGLPPLIALHCGGQPGVSGCSEPA
ncbi:MAG: hypothetical protein AAB341_03700 [Planctomycetota bacterium]|jgi:DNA-binding NarL/FixJ family response regulator